MPGVTNVAEPNIENQVIVVTIDPETFNKDEALAALRAAGDNFSESTIQQ